MSEGTMARRMGKGPAQGAERPHEFETVRQAGVVVLDSATFPWLGKQTVQIGFVEVTLGGRKILIGSAVKTHPAFERLARELSPTDSNRSNGLFNNTAGDLLKAGTFEAAMLVNHQAPNILIRNTGDGFSPNSMHLAMIRLTVKGKDALIKVCPYKACDSGKVIRIMEQSGYKCSGDHRLRQVKS